MKNIFLFLFITSLIVAQTNQTKSLAELQSQFNGMQNPKFELQNIGLRPDNFEDQVQQIKSKKNPGLAILFSMILPGMGELYANDYGSGKYFTIADGVLWGVFAGFNAYGNWKEDNYKSFAQSKAGVNTSGKDDDYFVNLGVYMSVDEYNTAQELDREFVKTYNSPAYYWKWQNDSDRKEYRNMWSSSESAYTNVRFAVGALVLNRLISAINAVRLVSAYNKNINQQTEIGYYFSYRQSATLPSSINLNIIKAF